MTRSPLFYPLNRGLDAEAGGVADLQTDVMRFMAILSLCLVAIFALVLSIPLTPSPAESAPPRAVTEPKPEVAPQEASPEERVEITRPKPRPARPVEPLEEALAVPEAPAQTPAPVAERPVTDPPVTEPVGFTLRFASDLALTRLVARNEVGLYAIAPQKSLRMNVNRGALSFWPASVPNEFHEMDAATVPDDVQSALRRATADIETVKWGVTLPSDMQRQMNAYLSESAGGTLIINADGNLRLEP